MLGFNLLIPKDLNLDIPKSLKQFENDYLFYSIYFIIYNGDEKIKNDGELFLLNFFNNIEDDTLYWIEHWEGNSLFYVDVFFSNIFEKFKINKKITFINGNILKYEKFSLNQMFSLETLPVIMNYNYHVKDELKPKYKFFLQGGRQKKERNYILDLFKTYEIDDESYNHTISLFSNSNEGRDVNGKLKYTFQEMSDLITQSYFHIVCETMHPLNSNYWHGSFNNPPSMCYTEKTGYPIYHKKPFFMINIQYSLYNLKQLGFKTFSNVWSEDYDNKRSVKDRIDSIFDIVLWLDTLNEPQLNKILRKTNESVNHNYQLLKKIKNEPELFGKLNSDNYNFKSPWLDSI